jgi:hypothetical protein
METVFVKPMLILWISLTVNVQLDILHLAVNVNPQHAVLKLQEDILR